jgi:lysozyme
MTWLELAIPLVAVFEGCARRQGLLVYPYLDTLAKPPRPTRGYGRTYGITMESEAITVEQAKAELGVGLSAYAQRVLKLAPKLLTRPACLAAVTSWAWNCGLGAFAVSRLRKAINEERWDDASALLLKPDTAGGVVYRGLQRRRQAEQALFASGVM